MAVREVQREEIASAAKRAFARALSTRDPALGAHTNAVHDLSCAVGARFGLGERELDVLGQAACLHDVGKLAIPEAILSKPGPLDEEEWAQMRRHTVIGERMVADVPALRPAAALVRASHERFDGRGYPDGLAGEEIPLGARVIFACDAYDAMVTERPYSGAMSAVPALAELRRCAGSQFDPVVVETLCAVVGGDVEAGFGVLVPAD